VIPIDRFLDAARAVSGVDLRGPHSVPQREAVEADLNQSLFLVAGPGSGKTTSSALRLLKLIFVDDVKTDQILATTFTRKAASALRSKLVDYGEGLRELLKKESSNPILTRAIDRIDLNAMRLGTIDSIAQDLLTEFRPAAAPAPRPIEEFARSAVFLIDGVLNHGLQHSQKSMPALYAKLYGGTLAPAAAARAKMLLDIYDRCANDRVDTQKWRAANQGQDDYARGVRKALDAIDAVKQRYVEEHVCDFAGLSESFLAALQSGALNPYLVNLKFVFVDEYQDTNLLQEGIYFHLAKSACASGGAICVVGDDDQSIYRFRGATVDLFQDFARRLKMQIGVVPKRIELLNNFRSTPEIIRFVNEFVALDPAFAPGRVQPPKPQIAPTRTGATAYPIIGIFEPTKAALALKLADFIDKIVNGTGVTVTAKGQTINIATDKKNGGSAHDVALLMSSVKETNTTGKPRLPLLLRDALANLKKPISVFNPRGQDLADQPKVQLLLGLALLCIDPSGTVMADVKMSSQKQLTLSLWRIAAEQHLQTAPKGLAGYVKNWETRSPTRNGPKDRLARERVNLNEIFYKLLSWIPELQYDVEQIALLEAVTRTVASAAVFASWDCEIVFGHKPPLAQEAMQSVKSAIQTVFVPLVEGVIDINEDLLDTLPRDRISILTIHQAKGLEFPVTIVDVGSDGENLNSFRKNRRYPDNAAPAHLYEDELRKYSLMGPPKRSGLDRAFDDLVRQYYVAYSRPQDVLVLTGVARCIDVKKPIENVATGWRRGGKTPCAWPQLTNLVLWS
jgi:DNA helicase II / ATP-dependent DNA helicase PcrA